MAETTDLDLLNTGWSKETKLTVLNIGILGGMMAYGLIFWDYGEQGFEFTNEGWFTDDTKYGGADKLGHAISTYFAVQAFSSTYERWGYDRHLGNVYGAILGGLLFGMVQTLSAALIPRGSEFRDVVAFAVVMLFLIVRPSGILGEKAVERV